MSALRQRMQRLLSKSATPTPDNETEVFSTAPTSLRRIVARHEAPAWLRDNEYIHTGFRRPSYSYLGSFASLTYLHNETVNIYSHLIGAISLPAAAVVLFIRSHRYKIAGRADLIVFGVFFVGAVACLSMSATYHALSNHSPNVHNLWLRLDVTGIAVLTAATFVPGVYYGFYCEPLLQNIYWTMITTFASAGAVVVLLPRFGTSKWRGFRAGVFIAMGLSALIPIAHSIRLFGLAQSHRQCGLYWFLLEGLFYALGATAYVKLIPERWRPGAFDILGSSHQVFHMLVLFGVASHLKGLVVGFDYNHSHIRC